MDPKVLGTKYDKIAQWWHEGHLASNYGLDQIKRAISYCANKGNALDVGCGSGGRITKELLASGFSITGLDVSAQMIEIGRANHPEVNFINDDICKWQSPAKFDFIVAWDSIFHLPFKSQVPVVSKLCGMLNNDGILIYSFGNDYGEHENQWRDDTFYYSTIGITENLRVISESSCRCMHLELDQYPQKHVYVIAQRT
ncbi:class I SAM-dependent methyltransferase [uncultured Imperialibacter sp.]|uniref:class I SAM-dependent methyltransferase n=1 Tax=uncultured Imperialibacter sp. TaxID=1672639 RepID=UPI0030D7A1CD|tara:strand:- start:45355 stop:45948 length:594 start_codon:yes stop_codon:yes gene_type:complete